MNDRPDDVLDGPQSGAVKLTPFSPSSEAVAIRDQSMMDVAMTRAAQEVQAHMVIAKKYPRSEAVAHQKIMEACKRPRLAEDAEYAFPKGGKTVGGPSIRMAEMLARYYGNIEYGVTELGRQNGVSTMLAYAVDYETNARVTKVFEVAHIRDTRQGSKNLDDQRDIYELTANHGARRVRACILALIPGDFIEDALDECDKTLRGNNKEPIADRIRAMVTKFDEYAVTPAMIEKRLGHRIDTTTESELVGLGRIFKSIRDNMASKEQFFDVPAAGAGPASKPIVGATARKTPEERKEAAKAPAAPPADAVPAVTAEEMAACVDQPSCLTLMGQLCERDGVSLPQVHKLAQTRNLAGKKTEGAGQMSEFNLKLILNNWPVWVPDLKKVTI